MVSVTTSQLCHHSPKAARDDSQTNERGYDPVTTNVYGSSRGPEVCSVLTPAPAPSKEQSGASWNGQLHKCQLLYQCPCCHSFPLGPHSLPESHRDVSRSPGSPVEVSIRHLARPRQTLMVIQDKAQSQTGCALRLVRRTGSRHKEDRQVSQIRAGDNWLPRKVFTQGEASVKNLSGVLPLL